MISVEDYFKAYAGHPEITPEKIDRAWILLQRVNVALTEALVAGVPLQHNPTTGTYVSGQKNGGFRISTTSVGAAKSQHREARAVDVYDPNRALATWVIANQARMRELGLWIEDPRWTPTWVHLQSLAPGSGNLVFVPSMTAPLADPVEGQLT